MRPIRGGGAPSPALTQSRQDAATFILIRGAPLANKNRAGTGAPAALPMRRAAGRRHLQEPQEAAGGPPCCAASQDERRYQAS